MTNHEQQDICKRWISEHGAILHRTVRGFAKGDETDDLMQELLLALWKAIPAFRNESRSSTFVYRVVHNAALTWRRGRAKQTAEPLASPEDVAEVEGRTSQQDDDRLLEMLYEHIHNLNHIDRSLLLLSLDGLSYDEIGEVHGLKANAVGVRLHRLRKQLLESLKEKTDDI